MLPWSVTEKVQRDVEEMRAFYASLGVAPETTERALAVCFPTLPATQVSGPRMVRRRSPKTRVRQLKSDIEE
jgi:hypothetical protein